MPDCCDVMEQFGKLIKEMQEATTNANIPSDLRDLANAYRDRAVMLREKYNDLAAECENFMTIEEFDPVPE